MLATFGSIAFPLDPADYTDSFAPADPTRGTLLALFRAAIIAELGAVWTKVTNTLPSTHDLRGTDPVEDLLELPPTHEVMQQRKASFPLLCLHRVETRTYAATSSNNTELAQPWNLHWILGPLDVANSRKLHDACLIIEGIVNGVIAQGYHDAYLAGARQIGSGTSIPRIKVTKAEGPGQSRYGGTDEGPVYWALVITIETAEFGTDTGIDGETGDPILDGAAYDVGAGGPEGRLPSVALGDTDSILE